MLIDIDGNRYLDGVSSLWCNIHGHRHPKIDAAIRRQLDRGGPRDEPGASNPTTIRLAKRLVDLAPPGLEHVFFSDDGATAVEVALKMAFQYWRQCPDPQPEKTCYAGPGRGLSRRHAGQRERRRGRAVPRHVPAAAVRDAPRAGAESVSHAAGRHATRMLLTTTSAELEQVLAAAPPADRRHGDRAAGAGGGGDDRAPAGLPARRPRADAASTTCS